VAITNSGCALRVDVDQNIPSVFQVGQNRLAQGPVIISVHACVFQKIPSFHPRLKIRAREKLIIVALNFAGSRRARCAGNGVKEIRSFTKRFDQRGLACA
jgi:hypothetical protein